MLDKKLKEQIYYGNNQPKKEFNNKAFYILVAVIIGFALIVAIISINSNNNTYYEQPTQERNLTDIVGEKPAEKIEQQSEPEQKTYTEAEIQADIKTYKNNFISKVKPNWHPNEESFLIDNDSLQVKIDKSGNVTFPDYPTGSYDANSQVILQAVESGRPYDKLPDSYDSECLTFKIYFEGNTESYWGNAQPKSSYQVSLSPIKTVTKSKISTTQKSYANNSVKESKNIPQNKYYNFQEYLYAVKIMLRNNYDPGNYSVDCTMIVTPSESVKILKDDWNADIAYNFLNSISHQLPKYYDKQGNIVPIVIKFNEKSIVKVELQYSPD